MSDDRGDNGETKRAKGSVFDIPDELETGPESKRNTRVFTPDSKDALTDIPEAITAGERLPHVSEYESIGLESLPLKGLKAFLYGLGCLILLIACAEVYSGYKYAAEMHSLAAFVYLLLVVLVIGLGARALWNYVRDPSNFSALGDIQREARYLLDGQSFGNSKPFVEELERFYVGKPHAVYFQRCIDQLPDYNNDRETINHIDTIFLEPLDKEAIRRISNHCMQTGTLVAVSPWAAADMLLSLWRSAKMIDEISEVYGLRPSMPNRLKLIRAVARQVMFVGATQVATDIAIEAFGSQSLASVASVRLGQGIGAALYTARIGIAAMCMTRPIEFSEAKIPKSRALVGPILQSLKKRATTNES